MKAIIRKEIHLTTTVEKVLTREAKNLKIKLKKHIENLLEAHTSCKDAEKVSNK